MTAASFSSQSYLHHHREQMYRQILMHSFPYVTQRSLPGMETQITYPDEFMVIISVLFGAEIIIGTSLNVYLTVKWIKERNIHRKVSDGNNFLTTLKVIDILICLFVIPLTLCAVVIDRHHNTVVCFFKEGLVVFASSGSAVGVLLISVDRYCAVVLPTKNVLTPTRVHTCIVTVVIVGIIGFLLPTFGLMMGHFDRGVKLSDPVLPCRHVIWNFQENYIYEVYFIVLFFFAMVVVFLCYRSVIKVVRKRLNKRTNILASTSTEIGVKDVDSKTFRSRRQEYKATRIAFAVVLSFLICWGPHVFVTMFQLAFPSSVLIDIIQFVTLVIAYLTTIIHPILYSNETRERSTTYIPKAENIPCLNKCFNRRSLKVTPNYTKSQTLVEQSCSCVTSNIQPTTMSSLSNTKLNVTEC